MMLCVGMDIINQLGKIAVIINQRPFEGSLKQGAYTLLLVIERHGIALKKFSELMADDLMRVHLLHL